MYQRDYILRMIEMISSLIAGILGMIRKGEFQKASQSLDRIYVDFLKQDASFLNRIKKEELTDKLLNEHNYTNGHLEILSELFYAQAELFYAQGKKSDSLEFYEKALILTEYAEKGSSSFSYEKQSKISLLKQRISQLGSKE